MCCPTLSIGMGLQYKAKIVHSRIELDWVSPTLVTELPFPGTRAFAAIIKGLEPYQPDASRITVETPSTKLSEVFVRFGLRNGEIELRLYYTGFKIVALPFEKSHASELGLLAMVAFNNLGFREMLPPRGRLNVHYQAHLQLEGGSLALLLREHVSSPLAGLEPDGCSYLFTSPDSNAVRPAKLQVERSLRFDESLFVDFLLELDVVEDLDMLVGRSMETIGNAIDSIKIQLQ